MRTQTPRYATLRTHAHTSARAGRVNEKNTRARETSRPVWFDFSIEQMWPPLHVLNFWLVPKHWRPLAGHLAGVALLAVISSTALTDAGLPLGQRAMPLMMRWASAVGERLGRKGRRASGAPPPAGN